MVFPIVTHVLSDELSEARLSARTPKDLTAVPVKCGSTSHRRNLCVGRFQQRRGPNLLTVSACSRGLSNLALVLAGLGVYFV